MAKVAKPKEPVHPTTVQPSAEIIAQPSEIKESANNPAATFIPDGAPTAYSQPGKGMVTVFANGKESKMAAHFASQLQQADATTKIIK